MVEEDEVFVFGFVEISHGASPATVFLHKLIFVVALFEKNGLFVAVVQLVVFHATFGVEGAVGPLPAHIDIPSLEARRVEGEVDKDVFCGGGIVLIVAASEHIHTVLVLVVVVVVRGLLGKEGGVVIRLKPFHPVHSHGGAVDVEYLELVELVAGRENEVPVVGEFYAVGLSHVVLWVFHSAFPEAVLQDDHVEFLLRIDDGEGAEVHAKGELLVGIVEVNVGVAADFGANAGVLLADTETGFKDRVVDVLSLFVEEHTVVAAHPQTGLFVGEGNAVVGVELDGVETGLIVLHRLVVVALQEIAFENALRGCPVGLAVLDVVDVAVVFVAHLVPTYLDVLELAHLQDGWKERIVIYDGLESPYLLVVDDVLLSPGGYAATA